MKMINFFGFNYLFELLFYLERYNLPKVEKGGKKMWRQMGYCYCVRINLRFLDLT